MAGPGRAQRLDGFSTTAVIRETFNGPIDAASLGNAGAVVVVHINTNNLTKAPVSPLQGGTFVPLTGCVKGGATCTAANFDYMVAPADENPTILEITPLRPLAASTCLPTPPATTSPCAAADGGKGEAYMVLLTKAITVHGVPAVPDVDYANFQAAARLGGPTCPSITDPTLNALCQLTGAHLALGQALGREPGEHRASFTSRPSRRSTRWPPPPRKPLRSQSRSTPSGRPRTAFGGLGFADVYVGVHDPAVLPEQERSDHGSVAGPASRSGQDQHLHHALQPVADCDREAAADAGAGDGAECHLGHHQPGGGWPIMVFQHGITADRTNLLAIADSFALGGMVGIAIDLPLHGLTRPFNPADPTTYLYASAPTLPTPTSGCRRRPRSSAPSIWTPTTQQRRRERLERLALLGASAACSPSATICARSSVDLVTVADVVSAPRTPRWQRAVHRPDQGPLPRPLPGAIVGRHFLAVMPRTPVLSATLANPGGKFI